MLIDVLLKMYLARALTLTFFCRFLALKNLATVFLQRGSNFRENALKCYLQAVEIDSKDSVVWNQLGTLSCSMGLLSISRWAFEQGLVCSPNNCESLFICIRYTCTLTCVFSFLYNNFLFICRLRFA